MNVTVTPIYLGGKSPRLGIVNDGADIGTLAVHTGSKWELIVDLRSYKHLIAKTEPVVIVKKKAGRKKKTRSVFEGGETP